MTIWVHGHAKWLKDARAFAEQRRRYNLRMKRQEKMTVEEYHNEFPDCAICNNPETVVHHILLKGIGGSKVRDVKNNWVTLCNNCHLRAHGLRHPKLSKETLFEAKWKMEKKREEEYIFGGVN